MRFWLVLLMMALLPLRGWAGEVVAGAAVEQRMAAALATQDAKVDTQTQVQSQAPLPCHGVSATPPAQTDASAAGTADAGTCVHCQMCSPVAPQQLSAAAPARALPHAVPAAPAPRFASALPHRILKPPIALA